uniref:Polymer-forming cytoskeletal protein n=1 Tax=Thermodesulfobacterium geofontis TaxID=1295609 RepID=A0A7V5XFS4_9BACT
MIKYFDRIFNKINKKRDQKDLEEIRTFICSGCFFEGNISIGEGVTRIDGEIQGNVKGKGGLLVGKNGVIKGDVEVKKLLLYGQIFGDIKAEEVELYSGSIVKGNIKTKFIYIERGASINGLCETEISEASTS